MISYTHCAVKFYKLQYFTFKKGTVVYKSTHRELTVLQYNCYTTRQDAGGLLFLKTWSQLLGDKPRLM